MAAASKVKNQIIILGIVIVSLIAVLVGVIYFGFRGTGIPTQVKQSITQKSTNTTSTSSSDDATVFTDRNGIQLFTIAKAKAGDKKAPHYIDYTTMQLDTIFADKLSENEHGLDYIKGKGYTIKTAVDLPTQELLQETLKRQVADSNFQKFIGAQNAAGVVIDPKTGEILAMVGSKDFYAESTDPKFHPQFNAALGSRSPGSSIKPFVYLSALRGGAQVFSPVPDKRLDLRWDGSVMSYYPHNFDRKFGMFGEILPMRTALARSLNVPVIATLNQVGKTNFVDTYQRLTGLSKFGDTVAGPSAAIGSTNVTLLDNTHAYATLANGGAYHDGISILEIKDKDGKVVYAPKRESTKAVDAKYAYAINDMNKHYWLFDYDQSLKDLSANMDIAGITGTSDSPDGRPGDVSFYAYTPNVVMSMWAGNDCGSMKCLLNGDATGEALYRYAFKQFLEKYQAKIAPARFTKPDGIKQGQGCTTYDGAKNCTAPSTDIVVDAPYDYTLPSPKGW